MRRRPRSPLSRLTARPAHPLLPWACLLLALAQAGGCAVPRDDARARISDRWGVEVESARLTAAGRMVDVRLRVLDPEKAAPLLDRAVKPRLIEETTGAVLPIPAYPKVGSLRQTTLEPIGGRTYFIIFSNAGGTVRRGGRVTVEIGDFRAEAVAVE
ncbi:MAG: hypothetical protein PHN82_06945 [bacterium]|nr:hypothetical protein [bacterium]